MANFLKKKLVDAGLITDDPALAEASDKPQKAQATQPVAVPYRVIPRAGQTSPTSAPQGASTAPVVSEVNSETVAQLESCVAASNKAGYTEFQTMLGVLQAVPEDVRVPTALNAVLASNKIAPKDILAAVDDRIRLLKQERQVFDRSMEKATAETVTANVQEISRLAEDIGNLQKQITDLQSRQTALGNEAQTAKDNIEQTKADFAAAYAVVEARLNTERARIAANIPQGGK